MGDEIHLYSEELQHGRINTVAELNEKFYHMGAEPPTISTAIFAYQEAKERELTGEELRQVMIDNNLISQGV
jgi:hypothetical protein